MSPAWIVSAAAILLFGVVTARLLSAWWKYRGARVITCPENLRPAGVRLDARRAAFTPIGQSPEFRLSSCSRWPERAGCGQECLAQISESPEGCLVRNILIEWYRGKSCACCGKPFGEIEWATQKPALILADKFSVEWSLIKPEELPGTLQTALPVCFACHLANSLVREHPDLVTDRSRRISV
jgi:hypothetical protein